jgi:hypothetical protein
MTDSILFSTIDRMLKVTVICLLLLLIGFEMVPINSIRDTQQYIVNAGYQRARSQMLERCAYALQYGPATEKAQARSILQSRIILFQQEQTLLLTNPDSDIQRLLQASQTDYLSIAAAVHVLIMHPDMPIELDILMLHDRRFFSQMNAVVFLLEQHLEVRNTQLLTIRVLLIVACIVSSTRFREHPIMGSDGGLICNEMKQKPIFLLFNWRAFPVPH